VAEFILSMLAVAPVFFRSRSDTAIEVPLRQQVAVLKRKRPRPTLNSLDRFFWTTLRRFWSRWTDALVIVKPETVIGWHRTGFRLYWCWRSRPRGGRPKITEEIRGLIRRLAPAKLPLRGLVSSNGFGVPARLPLMSQKSHVEAAEDIILDRAVTPIGRDVGALPEVLDAGRVFANPERRILLFDRGNGGGSLVDVAGRADAVQAGLAGENFKKYPPVPRPGAGSDGLHAGDFDVGQGADCAGIAFGGSQKGDLQKCAAFQFVGS
jgi:hypothetical protein